MPRHLSGAAAALLSGLGVALCLPKPGLCFLGWFALAPLFYSVDRRPPRDAFKLGFLAGFAFHGLAFYWIYSTCRFAGVPVPVALLAWAALAAFQALAWGATAAFGRWATQTLPPWAKGLGWAAAWTAMAVIWERWTPRLPGDLLEYTQWRNLALIQIASLTGPHGLGFLVAFVNAAIAQVWDETQESRGKTTSAAPGLALATALLIAAWCYGVWALDLRPLGTDDKAKISNVEILQPLVDQYKKWDQQYVDEIAATFDALLSRPRAAKPDLIVWPESSVPRWIAEGQVPPEISAWSRKLEAAQIVGVVSLDEGGHYNSAFLVGADGGLRGTYHKRELVPFGETVPFPWLRGFIGILNELGGITAGAREQALFSTPLGPAAVSICYEAVFPRWARFDAARGARVFVNITNDGWYKDTWGPHQHFNTNVFRAVENRATVVRAGNTGISAVIDPWGRQTARLDLGLRGRLDAAVPAQAAFPLGSFYARHGDWLGWLCLALAVGWSAWRAAGLRPRRS